MRPKYWPMATSGALIVIQMSVVPFFFRWIDLSALGPFLSGALSETMIVTPAGATVDTSRSWSLSLTLIAVRLVVMRPVIVGASTLAMLRSMRDSGAAAEDT